MESVALGPMGLHFMAYRNVSNMELGQCCSDWEPDLVEMLSMPEELSKWEIYTVGPLPSFVAEKAHVALIGDAAHAMTPHLGLGIAQMIEDAYVLYCLFLHPDMAFATLSKALKAFDKVSRPRAQEAAMASLKISYVFEFHKLSRDFSGEPVEEAPPDEIAAFLGNICDQLKDENRCAKAGNKALAMFDP